MGTPFHSPRQHRAAGAGPAFPSSFYPPVSHPPPHHYSHRQFDFPEIPSFNFYEPCAFESDPRLSFPFHNFPDVGHSSVPFPGPAAEFGAASGVEFGMPTGYENGGEEVRDSDLYRREEEHEVRLTVDMFDRPREGPYLNLGLSLGFGQGDDDMDYNSGMGIGVEDGDVAREVDLELKLGLGSESGREANTSEFRGFYGEELNFPRGFRETGTDSERIAGFDHHQFRPDVVHPMERTDSFDFPVCYDHFVLLGEHLDHVSQLAEESAFLYDWYGVRDENDVLVHPDLYYGDGINWETLLAANYMNRDVDDPIDGVVEESMNEWRGNPPAAKSVVEALPIVKLSRDELKGKELSCAVCFAELSVGEKVRQLPCSHYFHGGCILPWLDLRNTCPVCRYELPTEDPAYDHQEWEMED